jgi:hypothetical protein
MFKFLLIIIIAFYAIYRIGGFFFRIFSASHQGQESPDQSSNAQTRVDRNSKNEKKPFDGGEYIDYEEVK